MCDRHCAQVGDAPADFCALVSDCGGGTFDTSLFGVHRAAGSSVTTIKPLFGDRGIRRGSIDVDHALTQNFLHPLLSILGSQATAPGFPALRKDLLTGADAGFDIAPVDLFNGDRFEASFGFPAYLDMREQWKRKFFNAASFSGHLELAPFIQFVSQVIPDATGNQVRAAVRAAALALGRRGHHTDMIELAEEHDVGLIKGGIIGPCWRGVADECAALVSSILGSVKTTPVATDIRSIRLLQVGGPSSSPFFHQTLLNAAKTQFNGPPEKWPLIEDAERTHSEGETAAVIGGLLDTWTRQPKV